MFLARKIMRAKWGAQSELAEGEISADALTGDLRTQGNTLSFWRCHDGADNDIEDAALAIAAAHERLDKLDIVWLTHEELRADGQTVNDTIGRTPVLDLAERHVDVSKLDHVRLGQIACRVAAAIEDDRFCRLTKPRIKTLLVAAIEHGRINIEDLNPKLQAEIGG